MFYVPQFLKGPREKFFFVYAYHFLSRPFKAPSTWDSQSAGGSRSVHLLSFLVIVRLVPHSDLLRLLLGQRFSVSVTMPGCCVNHCAVRMLFQPGQQAEDILGHVSSLQIRMLITTATAAELRIVRAAHFWKVFISFEPSPRNSRACSESCLINSSLCFPACRFFS